VRNEKKMILHWLSHRWFEF